MSTNPQSSGTFARAFLPGLVLGLIIGGVVGAVLPELMRPRPPAPTPEQIAENRDNAARDGQAAEDDLAGVEETPLQTDADPAQAPAADPEPQSPEPAPEN